MRENVHNLYGSFDRVIVNDNEVYTQSECHLWLNICDCCVELISE